MKNGILLTGASGFVGQRLIKECHVRSIPLKCAVRSNSLKLQENTCLIPSIDGNTDWKEAISGVSTVVHLAARAHIMNDTAQDPITEYRRVNTQGTLNLARQSALAGVKRLIFISSIKVNGESTTSRQPFSEQSTPKPVDPYGISKHEAESELFEIAKESGMEVVIIRPPLIYGPNVRANFYNLIKLADSHIPLPFSIIHNHRSMVYVDNLVDFIINCIEHPAAANQVFNISDGIDISLAELIKHIRLALGKPVFLFPVPKVFFRIAGKLTGRNAIVERLIGDLQIDSSKANVLLKWSPPYSIQQGIKATITAYLKGKK